MKGRSPGEAYPTRAARLPRLYCIAAQTRLGVSGMLMCATFFPGAGRSPPRSEPKTTTFLHRSVFPRSGRQGQSIARQSQAARSRQDDSR